jgi:hypothetical protein
MLFKSAPRFWEKSSFVKEPIRALIDRLISTALLPLAWLFGLLVWLKQILIDTGITQALGMHRAAPVPLIIVGNIRVGGTGKTPLVIALANALFEEGFRPGIISRGYQPNGQSTLEAPKKSFKLAIQIPSAMNPFSWHSASISKYRFGSFLNVRSPLMLYSKPTLRSTSLLVMMAYNMLD